jgi:hypothetical protein
LGRLGAARAGLGLAGTFLGRQTLQGGFGRHREKGWPQKAQKAQKGELGFRIQPWGSELAPKG